MKRALWLVAPMLASCGPRPPTAAQGAGPAFDPVAFFAGTSHGEAVLRQLLKPARRVTVDSRGVVGPDGTLTLAQRIMTQGDPPRQRWWTMKPVGPGRWAGRLTDAVGPVETVAQGGAIRIRYTMKHGLDVEQWLVAMPGGRRLDNHLYVTKFGIGVADLHEVITRR